MTNGKRFLSFFLITAFVVAAGPAAAQTADVLVIHNSPDPAAEVVDVYLDGTLAVPGFAFQTAGVVELPAGDQIEIGIAPGPGSEMTGATRGRPSARGVRCQILPQPTAHRAERTSSTRWNWIRAFWA